MSPAWQSPRPLLVRATSLCGSDLFAGQRRSALIGTSEQTLVYYHADETSRRPPAAMLYRHTPWFRTKQEATARNPAYFPRISSTVEQIIFCLPEDSPKYHEVCQEMRNICCSAGYSLPGCQCLRRRHGAPGYKNMTSRPGTRHGGYREVTRIPT